MNTSEAINALQPSPADWAGLVAFVIALTSGAMGALGLGSYLYFRGRSRLKQRRTREERHLQRLQRLTSKLLNACDQLLAGQTPEETLLYQQFIARGGEAYNDLRTNLYEAVRRSQSALNSAFELRQKLIDPTVQQRHSLEQKIWDWEILYATLIGRSQRIKNLTGDELRSLLDPMLASEREASDIRLARQLEDLQRELTGTPLKITWQKIYPTQIEAKGILSYIDQVKAEIAKLPERRCPARPRQPPTGAPGSVCRSLSPPSSRRSWAPSPT
jgi:hypothetical protein